MTKFYVYVLFRLSGEPCYVGKGCGKRFSLNGRHNKELKKIVAESGGQIPKVKVRENLGEEEAFECERALIAAIGRGKNGPLVNRSDGGEGPSGYRHTDEARRKISEAHRGKKLRLGSKMPEHQMEILRSANTGRKKTPEEIEKLRASHTGLKMSEEARQKMREAKLGRPLSLEHKAKIAAGNRGKILSSETRARISQGKTGKKWSDESRAILRAANRSRDPEVRAKISEGVRRSNAKAQEIV